MFKTMKVFFQRIKLSIRYIAKTACEWTAAVYAVAGLLSLFVSFEGFFTEDTKTWTKIIIAAVILACVWLLCAIAKAVCVGVRNKKKVVDGHNGKAVYVVFGDLFDPTIVKGQKRYIAFAVNRCFDTIVNDRLVSSTTIHGMAFKKLYASGQYKEDTLNDAIQRTIKGNPSSITLTEDEKPEGNLQRYEVGTYANLPIEDKLNYLLIGLSWFDKNLNAQTSLQDYALAMQKMIAAFDKESQGYPVLMPVIGTGRSRTDLQDREALEYLVEAFKINQTKIKSDVYIVIYESAKNRVAIADL